VLVLAFLVGLIGGTGLAFALERRAPRLYTLGAIESAADAEVLATIPRAPEGRHGRAVYNGGSPAQEAYGMLAVQVLAAAQSRSVKTILVTSCRQGEGKSSVAANLAAQLARSGCLVTVIDGDLRAPTQHSIFGVNGDFGLSQLLADPTLVACTQASILQCRGFNNLDVLPAGPASAAAQLLASPQLSKVLEQVLKLAQFVVIDAPPLVISDPLALARHADLVILVVGDAGVEERDVQAARRQLASVGAEHVSVVANRWSGREMTYAYKYAYGKRG
jgi:capsular exopolysaccharide synthesis family protein